MDKHKVVYLYDDILLTLKEINLTQPAKEIKLKILTLDERSHIQKTTCLMIPFLEISRKSTSIDWWLIMSSDTNEIVCK